MSLLRWPIQHGPHTEGWTGSVAFAKHALAQAAERRGEIPMWEPEHVGRDVLAYLRLEREDCLTLVTGVFLHLRWLAGLDGAPRPGER